MCNVDADNRLLPMTPSQDGIPPPDPLRLDWPKVINVQFTKWMSELVSYLIKEHAVFT